MKTTSVIATGNGTGAFSAKVDRLSDSQTYYVWAFVETEQGYVFGERLTFSTYEE